MRNKEQEEQEDDTAIAQTVYGDLVTFLMVLFLLLFIFSQQIKNEGFFIVNKKDKRGGSTEQKTQSNLAIKNPLNTAVQNFIKKEQLEKVLHIVENEESIKLILETPLLFNSGKSELTNNAIKVLNKLAKILKNVENDIIIEGHTDNVPIHNEAYNSNWELSFFRAFSVTQYLINKHQFKPTQLSCLGYGEYRPLVPNTNKENKAKNRRIEINIIRIKPTNT
ncbi:MAG: OmpA family protein [bacterium]